MRPAFHPARHACFAALMLLACALGACNPTPPREITPSAPPSTTVDSTPSPTMTSALQTSSPTPSQPTATPLAPTPTATGAPTPPPLPEPAASPAGAIFHGIFAAPGATPFEPVIQQVAVDALGALGGTPAPFAWSTLDDNRMIVGRLSASPTGAFLMSTYDTEAGESLVIVDLATARETAYLWGGQRFGWHPNGAEFLFEQREQADPGLWLVAAHTGEHRLLLSPAALQGATLSGAAISPDGNTLAYSLSAPGLEQIWMANADGSEPRRVLESNTSAIVHDWSPAGTWLLYSGEPIPETGKGTPAPPSARLWLMDSKGQNRRPLNLPWEPLGLADQHPVVSPDGRAIVGVGASGEPTACWKPGLALTVLCAFQNSALYIEDVETGNVRLIASNAMDPIWSPDGSLLAFSRMDVHGQVDIWIADAGQGDLQQVTASPEWDRYPVWLPAAQ